MNRERDFLDNDRVTRNGCIDAIILYVLLGKNAVNGIGDGYFGYDDSIDNAIRREFFDPEADQFKPSSPDWAKFCGFQSAGADVEPNSLLVSIKDS